MLYDYEIRTRTPVLLALSTCPRCERMKEYLRRQNVRAVVIDIDLLPREEKQAHLRFAQQVNPRVSFPTLVVGDLAVIGEDYDGAKEALGL